MKKPVLIAAICVLSCLSLTSCRETVKEETVVREVEAEKETPTEIEVKVEEDDNGILERTGEEIDREVDKELNEEIDKIGEDN